MKIKFEKLSTVNGKVYVNFGNGFKEYQISEVKDSGITIPEDCTDYSLIQIKGSSVILNNLDVISSIKTSDDNAISPEDITGIVLKDFNGIFDKSLLQKYPKLTSVTIPEGATFIGGYAFQGCSSLTSIAISDSVTSIGGSAFQDCSSLTSIFIPDNVKSISGGAFQNCSKLESITIPDSVTTIGDMAFAFCESLTSITIPDSVTSISGFAFVSCDSLMNINYKGTKEQWNAIEKDEIWYRGCSSNMTINYNYAE